MKKKPKTPELLAKPRGFARQLLDICYSLLGDIFAICSYRGYYTNNQSPVTNNGLFKTGGFAKGSPIQFFPAIFAIGMVANICPAQDLSFPPVINLSGQTEGVSTLNVRIAATNVFVPRVDAYGIYNDFAQSLEPVDIELQANKAVPVVSGTYSAEIPLFLGNNDVTISAAGGEEKDHFIKCENKMPKQLEVYLTWSDSRFNLQLNPFFGFGRDWLDASREHGKYFDSLILVGDAIKGGFYEIMVSGSGYARLPGHYHGADYVTDCYGIEFPPSGVSATVKIFMDGEEVYSVSNILETDYRYNHYSIYFEGEHHSQGFCLPWHIGYVALHAGDKTAAYTVNGTDIEPSTQGRHVGYRLNDSVWSEYEALPTLLEESNGTDPIYLKVGEAAQFNLSGTVSLNGTTTPAVFIHALDVVDVDNPANSPPEGSHALEKAMITPTGVFIGLAAGHYQVGIQENRWRKTIFSFYGSADFPPIDVYVVDPRITPDYNRDGVIDAADGARAKNGESFRFWVNDDDDFGDIAEGDSDVPGQGGLFSSANYEDGEVNGRCDLLDFFPVWLDLHDALSMLPADGGVEYKLRHDDEAVRFVYTDLTAGQATAFLTSEGNTYGPSFNQNAFEADTIKVTDSGIALGSDFLDRIANDPDKGVLMLEGIDASTKPLVLEIWQDGSKLFENKLTLSLSGVEEMYRHLNLRPDGDGHATTTGEPANNPDFSSNGKNAFFLHGFNVSGNAARAWNAEMFKRLHQAGSKADFWGVTWQGDLGLVNALHYQEDVANCFTVASDLAIFVAEVDQKTFMAHSLGNMVVSSAIEDYGMNMDAYFMLNAAVAIESYDATEFDTSTTGNYMVHEDWIGYDSDTWSATWHELFSSPDDRARLTWKNRFSSALNVAYNFCSTGDEIFELDDETPGIFSGGLFHLEQFAWQKQEVFKGRTGLGSTDEAGWGFSGKYTQAEANAATSDNFRTNAVFRQEPVEMFSANIAQQNQNEILALGIPALSEALGAAPLVPLPTEKNYDMNASKPNEWPRTSGRYAHRWLHSDLKNISYIYTHQLFDKLVENGGLE